MKHRREISYAFFLAVQVHDDLAPVGSPYLDVYDHDNSAGARQGLRTRSCLQHCTRQCYVHKVDKMIKTYKVQFYKIKIT